MIKNEFSSFESQISLKCEIFSICSGSKQQEKTIFETFSTLHFLPQVSCQ